MPHPNPAHLHFQRTSYLVTPQQALPPITKALQHKHSASGNSAHAGLVGERRGGGFGGAGLLTLPCTQRAHVYPCLEFPLYHTSSAFTLVTLSKNQPTAVDCMFVSPQNVHVEALIPNVMIFGDRAFERELGHEGRALMMGLVPFKEETAGR